MQFALGCADEVNRVQADELERLSRNQLIERAELLGVEHAEVLTRVELVDEIIRRSIPDPIERRIARGLMGVARDLVARVVERGLHLPDAAARIRARTGSGGATATSRGPIATVTLADIYAAQGHRVRALTVLDEVLEREPDHLAARQLRERIASAGNRDEPAIATVDDAQGIEREESPSPNDEDGRHIEPEMAPAPEPEEEVRFSAEQSAAADGQEAATDGQEAATDGDEEEEEAAAAEQSAAADRQEAAANGQEEVRFAAEEAPTVSRDEVNQFGAEEAPTANWEGADRFEAEEAPTSRDTGTRIRHAEVEAAEVDDDDTDVPATLRESLFPLTSSEVIVSRPDVTSGTGRPCEEDAIGFEGPEGEDAVSLDVADTVDGCEPPKGPPSQVQITALGAEADDGADGGATIAEGHAETLNGADTLCIWVVPEPGVAHVEWHVASDSVKALQLERGAGQLVLRFLTVVPTWGCPQVETRDREVGGDFGGCSVRQLPDRAVLRAAIGWRWMDGFQPIAVALAPSEVGSDTGPIERAMQRAGDWSETSWADFAR